MRILSGGEHGVAEYGAVGTVAYLIKLRIRICDVIKMSDKAAAHMAACGEAADQELIG
jgi:hypothetical protein